MPPTSSTPLANARAWRNAVFVIFALNGLGAGTWASRLPAVRDSLELSTSLVGYVILGLSIGSILGLLAAGHVVHLLGGRRTIAVTLALCAGGLVVMGVGATVLVSFPVVIAGMVIYGVGTAVCDVAMNVEGASVEKVLGKTLMPLFHASWSAGTVVGTSLGTVAAFAGVDPAVHFTVVAIILVAGAAFAPRPVPRFPVHSDTAEEMPKASFRERMAVWLEPRTLIIGLIALGMAFTEGSANDWLAIGMVDDRGLDNGQAAGMFTLFTVAMMIGRIVGGPLIDRYGRVTMLLASGGTAAVGLALVIFVPSIPFAIVGTLLWGLGASLGFPVAMSAAADDPARAAARVSAVATVGYCAFLVGPPLLGFVGEQVGILNALIIVFALLVVATLSSPAAREQGAGRRGKDVTSEPSASETMS